MRRYGLLGKRIRYSISPQVHATLWRESGVEDCVYDLYDTETPATFVSLVRREPTFVGFNVTIPYKEEIVQYMDSLDTVAAELGAVNTVCKLSDHTLKGYNTDVAGFDSYLSDVTEWGAGAIVLGTGGAAKAVCYALQQRGIPYRSVSRTPTSENKALSYEALTGILHRHLLVVNTTPLGNRNHPTSAPPIPYRELTDRHTAIDLSYAPTITLFMRRCHEQGAATHNGLSMLIEQARAAQAVWRTIV